MAAAELQVLGPVEVVWDGDPIALAAKHRRLLAVLVAEGDACGIDEIVEGLWDGAAPASARKLVQVYVSQLRKALPSGIAIVTRQGAYAAELAPEVLDAARFAKLLGEAQQARRAGNPALALSLADRALALWRGRAYGDLSYCDFARAESERLEELRLVAVEEQLDALLGLGRHAATLAETLTFASDHPLRERAHELAMLALYRCGRQADALAHYAAFRAKLDEELGLEPGAPLRELQQRVLQQDPTLDAAVGERASSTLPVPPNPLVGREHELSELRVLLERRDSRLIVLTGAGGSGKTRLALEAARQAEGSYANGVALVELAPLRDAALVVPAIAQALDVSIDADDEPVEVVARALAPLELLLLVDNAEHVRESSTGLAELVSRAPRLTVLVTSRAVLHVSGEHVFPVAPLAEDHAVELFAQRARLLEPSFEITTENEADVREICRRVDGLPLAIELAAARIRTLTPRVLRERLDDRLALLTGGPRDLPARQQTLRETIDWSVGLLDELERVAFARLAVLPAGATVQAAQLVCGADLDTLAALVDVHLIRREDVGGEPRFGMLETVREYALELLGEERPRTELGLAGYFATFADALREATTERELRRLVDALDPEVENIRAALAAGAASGDGELQLRLAGGLSRYWQYRGPVAEGLEWIERALAASDGAATVARAHALRTGAGLAWMGGDVARATELAQAAIPVAIETRAKGDEGAAHTVLGIVANWNQDREHARYHHQRSLEISEELGIEPVVQKLNLGVVALDCGDYDEAVSLFEDVLASHRRNDNPAGIGYALLNLGLIHHELGDHRASRREFEEARDLFAIAGYREQHAQALQGLAAAEAHESHFDSAAQLLGEARKEFDDVGARGVFAEEMVEDVRRRSREALGDEAFEAAYAQGLQAG